MMMSDQCDLSKENWRTVVVFLESLGFEFGMDIDGVTVNVQHVAITEDDVMDLICRHPGNVAKALLDRAAVDRYQCIGGPMNGQRHGLGCYPYHFHDRVARGKWYAYAVSEDGRAFFQGYATSEAKAKELGRVAAEKMRPNQQISR